MQQERKPTFPSANRHKTLQLESQRLADDEDRLVMVTGNATSHILASYPADSGMPVLLWMMVVSSSVTVALQTTNERCELLLLLLLLL
jgi:hypothetical protein